MELEAELKKEYSDSFNWVAQGAISIAYLFRAFFISMGINILIIGFLAILTVSFIEPSDVAKFNIDQFSDFQNIFLRTALIIFFLSVSITVIFQLPGKLKNVFMYEAERSIQIHREVIDQIKSEVDTTESILLKHGLITQVDIDRRKSELSENKLI